MIKFQVQDQEREIRQISKQLGLATKECEDLSGVVAHHEKELTNATQGKIIYDVDDPNRPKFSLPELRKILQERNYLKARVSDLEDELVLYRPEKFDGYVFILIQIDLQSTLKIENTSFFFFQLFIFLAISQMCQRKMRQIEFVYLPQ